MGKKVLIVGSGGREHALAWKLAQSPEVDQIYVAPGNAGTLGWNVKIEANDIPALLAFAEEKEIDLTVVGPEEPLTLGIVDDFQAKGLRIFGPSRTAARLEGSKSFAKEIMHEANVPTARWEVFQDSQKAKAYIQKIGAPCVLKADGLAAGKGVIIAENQETALQAVDEIMEGALSTSGKTLVVEEFLTGPEISLLCFTDGKMALPMVPVQDHKRALDGDQGLNTGGMGTYSPPPFWTAELERQVMREVVQPTLSVMQERGETFQGVLFVGLMLTPEGPKVLEFNARFGDPETQVVMLRLESDLLPVLWACTEGTLQNVSLSWSPETAVCVVLASPGYPQAYTKGIPIHLPSQISESQAIFQAGTAASTEGQLINSGGRVLGVSAKATDLIQARQAAYELVEQIDFPQVHYRRDIGIKGLG
ncbi:phosphoribosylamine--glycine ligase [Desulfitobacterium sp.]|uniref:phosphoribosylamine--glycine ligase n=1 Tax=Desulfitobacterium sp. TaxID=49981 RepID=UPI002C846D99|nr:phosphoribosylamine--glycine ligase [Desulfitobacterium sp.]HVJ49465.1 phosphoribosylamine--glycine ligase [Desulfitobacterium sp.]